MNKQKFSAIAHRDHDYCNPVSAAKVERLLDLLPLDASSRVLDLGCGRAELSLRIIERFGSTVVAVDNSSMMLDAARERADWTGALAKLHLDDIDIREFQADPETFHLSVMLGGGGISGGMAAGATAIFAGEPTRWASGSTSFTVRVRSSVRPSDRALRRPRAIPLRVAPKPNRARLAGRDWSSAHRALPLRTHRSSQATPRAFSFQRSVFPFHARAPPGAPAAVCVHSSGAPLRRPRRASAPDVLQRDASRRGSPGLRAA